MIIPTPEYDRMFAHDGIPFRDKMIAYIRREFPDALGPSVAQLQTDKDLADLSRVTSNGSNDRSRRKNAAA